MIRRWRVRGGSPTSLEHFVAIEQKLHLSIVFDELRAIWEDFTSQCQLPELTAAVTKLDKQAASVAHRIRRRRVVDG